MKVMIVAGIGGHYEQARRVIETMAVYDDIDWVIVTDSNNDQILERKIYIQDPIEKFKQNTIVRLYNVTLFFLRALLLTYKEKPDVVISNGPGFGSLFLLAAKLNNKKYIFIESWSRFYNKSKAGKLADKIGAVIVIQNSELKKVYKKSIYIGRL
ncbi:hypothetical protein E0X81_12060 [Halomonas sp. GDM18]|nr:hypothetical protein E0X81_12060 [Halomonas sp. GDM18]